MTPAARVQAAIELVDAIIESAAAGGAAADTLIARYFKARRYAGSGDRRAVRELVFRAVRRAGERPASGRAALLGLADAATLFDGSPHGPARAAPEEPIAEAGIAPAWLLERFDPLVGRDEWPALLERAPLDVRINRLKAAEVSIPGAEPTPHAPFGLRLPEGTRIEPGPVEIQDEGSQLVCVGCAAAPGMFAIDLCAGAGGKTLALAADMANEGRLLACDADRGRLSRLPPRLARAGVAIAETRLLDPGKEEDMLADVAGQADLVLVDAPCSGSGTWRRNPETRWRITPERLERLAALQARLLDIGATLLRPGGRLVYAVCSLLAEEGRAQAEALTGRSSLVPEAPLMPTGRPAGAGLILTPARDGTDGFFVACWRSPC